MRSSRIAWGLVLLIGCNERMGNDAGMDTDAGMDDGGTVDPCDGLTLCAAPGSSCDGDELVECEENADGCLVETRTECGATNEVCDDSGSAACVDPCSLIPEADRCASEGRACAGDTLEVCAADADGCLVRTTTDCAAAPGGTCDDAGAMPMCVLPPDPCDAIPAADRCTTAGSSCSGDTLETCAADAMGCLVITRTDCTSRAGGACAGTMCTATDPCAGIAQCAAAGAECSGPVLVSCTPDAFGCLIETRTDCTDTTFGFCDVDPAGPDQCETAATDPCMGMVECGTMPSRSCPSTTTLADCAPNAFGCYVVTSTDCSASGDVCSASGGTAMCVDPCSLVVNCPSASYCDGGAAVTCADDANGCLVETGRDTCTADETCTESGGAAACTDVCPEAGMRVIDCASGTVNGDTAMGSTSFGGYPGCTTLSYPNAEQVWRFRNTGTVRRDVTIVSTRGTSTADYDLFVVDGSSGSSCTTPVVCVDGSTGTGATETVQFVAEPGATEYVVYDRYGTAAGTTDYTLSVTCVDVVCGDGVRHSSEQCDDGDTMAGDGCSDTCTVEAGWRCDGTPPTCRMIAANGSCSSGTPITGTTTITGEDISTGGPRPMGTGCGSSSGNDALYYAVTIPAGTSVAVTTTAAFDRVLLVQDTCGGSCAFRTDSPPEGTTLFNTGAAPITRYVAVHNYAAGTPGTYDITFTYAPLPANASCAGARSITGSTTITGENIALGGPRPQGTGCGSSSGDNALYYSVTVPPNSAVDVTTTGAFDRVLLVQDACGAASCTFRTDTSPERTTLVNTGASAITRIVAIHNYTSGTTGTYDISFAYTTLPANRTCAGATAITSTTTIMNENIALGGARPMGTGCGTSSGNSALYYAVTVPAMGAVDVTTTGTFDRVLLVQDTCGASSCTFRTDTSPERATLTNSTASPVTQIVAVHNYGTGDTGTYSITFQYPTCGDGIISTSEQCDDRDVDDMDGCSSSCQVEPGYACSGTPSVCMPFAMNSTCAGATAITANTTITGENIVLGGPRPMGTGCGSSSGNNALYYSVTIPANTRVDVTTTAGTLDRVLVVQDMCGAASCTFRTDTSPERASLSNTTSSPITQIVAIHNFSSSGTGTYDISFTYTALAPNASCSMPIVLAPGSSVSGNLATGGPRPTGTNCGSGAGPVLYYSVTIPANSAITVTGAPSTSFDLTLQQLGDCAGACISNVDSSASGPESIRLANASGSSVTRIVAVGSDAAGTFGSFDVFAGMPSMLAPNASCAGATSVTSDVLLNGDIALGGPRPQGTGCGTSNGDNALYYAVTIPAMTAVNVTTTATFDRVLLVQDTCGATSCSFRTDTPPEQARLTNPTSSPITRIVALHNYSAGTTGTFTINFVYSAIPAGDQCSNAITINAGDMLSGDTTTAGADLAESSVACDEGSFPGNDLVYAFTPTMSGSVTITVRPTTSWDPALWIMTPTCTGASCVQDDDSGGSGIDEAITLSVTAATTYYIVVDGWTSSARGPFTLSIM